MVAGRAFTTGNSADFLAKLNSSGVKVDRLDIKYKEEVDKILADLKKSTYKVTNMEQKEAKRLPSAPFTTSTLQTGSQQPPGIFGPKQTMRLAQMLYEGIELGSEGSVGLITYMRSNT